MAEKHKVVNLFLGEGKKNTAKLDSTPGENPPVFFFSRIKKKYKKKNKSMRKEARSGTLTWLRSSLHPRACDAAQRSRAAYYRWLPHLALTGFGTLFAASQLANVFFLFFFFFLLLQFLFPLLSSTSFCRWSDFPKKKSSLHSKQSNVNSGPGFETLSGKDEQERRGG